MIVLLVSLKGGKEKLNKQQKYMKNFSVMRQLMTLARTSIGKLYRLIRFKYYVHKRNKATWQFEVPTYCYTAKDKDDFIDKTVTFLEQNIKIIKDE